MVKSFNKVWRLLFQFPDDSDVNFPGLRQTEYFENYDTGDSRRSEILKLGGTILGFAELSSDSKLPKADES